MVFRLADGDILCNVDADNYAGPSFGKYVQHIFTTQSNVCLTGLNNKWKHDASVKLCVSRGDFMDVTGFDESFEGYGFEDYDIVNRLQLNGCKPYTIDIAEFLMDKSTILQTLNQPGCEGIRFYLGMRDSQESNPSLPGILTLVTVGVDSGGKDLNFGYNEGISFTDDIPDVENLSLCTEYPFVSAAIADKDNPGSQGLTPYVLYQYAKLTIQKNGSS